MGIFAARAETYAARAETERSQLPTRRLGGLLIVVVILWSATWRPIDIVLLIRVPALGDRAPSHVGPVVATIDHATRCLPVAAALQGPCIVAVPMISDPPTVDIVVG